MPTMLRLTKYGTCALILSPSMTCTTCQPPRPSGTEMRLVSVPAALAVALPNGIETKLQHVPLQLTRLPTTVDHTSCTGAPGARPDAVTSTFDRTGPEVELSCAVAVVPAASPVADSVVRALSVGSTATGQSIRWRGRPASLVTLNVNRLPTAHGIGDCGMLR